MKTVRFYGTNDVRIEEIDRPVPKGDEVLIRIGAAGVCHRSSTLMMQFNY